VITIACPRSPTLRYAVRLWRIVSASIFFPYSMFHNLCPTKYIHFLSITVKGKIQMIENFSMGIRARPVMRSILPRRSGNENMIQKKRGWIPARITREWHMGLWRDVGRRGSSPSPEGYWGYNCAPLLVLKRGDGVSSRGVYGDASM